MKVQPEILGINCFSEIVDKLNFFKKETEKVLKETDRFKRLNRTITGYLLDGVILSDREMIVNMFDSIIELRTVIKDVQSGISDITRRTITWHDKTVKREEKEDEEHEN